MVNNIHQVLGLDQDKSGSAVRYLTYGLILVIVVAALTWGFWPANNDKVVRYQTAAVKLADLKVTVTATGILQPLNQVEVGTEISGTVQEVPVDFNDRVVVGQVLARLNTDQLAAKLRQTRAALQLAKAAVKESEATVIETKARLGRALDLEKKHMTSPEQLDAARADAARAVASLERARAQVTQAEAQLDLDSTALSKAEIRSPINGIVLKRQIEPGQTVAASLQTPVLFTLAENLTQMELHVSVDEADVGMVREGQDAVFKVDAFMQRSFPAKISQVRFAPETVDGVVTYGTVLSVNNEDLSLRPGMTATAEIMVQQLKNVMQVPNTALRFKPAITAGAEKPNLVSQFFSRRPPREHRSATSDEEMMQKTVWVLKDDKPVKVSVTTGVSDGQMTQIVGGDLDASMAVIIDTISNGR